VASQKGQSSSTNGPVPLSAKVRDLQRRRVHPLFSDRIAGRVSHQFPAVEVFQFLSPQQHTEQAEE